MMTIYSDTFHWSGINIQELCNIHELFCIIQYKHYSSTTKQMRTQFLKTDKPVVTLTGHH